MSTLRKCIFEHACFPPLLISYFAALSHMGKVHLIVCHGGLESTPLIA